MAGALRDRQDGGGAMTRDKRAERVRLMRRLKIARQRFTAEMDRGNAPAALSAIAEELAVKAELSKLGRA